MKKIFVTISIVITLSMVLSIGALATQNDFVTMSSTFNNELILDDDFNSTIMGWSCITPSGNHVWPATWKPHVNYCWQKCSVCNAVDNTKPHSFVPGSIGGSRLCRDCGQLVKM